MKIKISKSIWYLDLPVKRSVSTEPIQYTTSPVSLFLCRHCRLIQLSYAQALYYLELVELFANESSNEIKWEFLIVYFRLN
jgi:hypothetical protein